jgi:hypothetical protein
MSEITTIGLDLAKHVFQVHGIDAEGTTVLRKRLRRGQVLAFFSRISRCVVGLEACATAWPLAARAQRPGKLPTMGFLGTTTPSAGANGSPAGHSTATCHSAPRAAELAR